MGTSSENISAWLVQLGLDRYIEQFEANDIDLERALLLRDADLDRLGIVATGDRRRLLEAVNELRSRIRQPDAREMERRQLTVMFSDIVGSTALSSSLDPEDFATVIGEYHRRCSAIVAHFGGYVAKFLGDGLLAIFGYPHGREDNAEQAIRAGLAIVEEMRRTEALPGIHIQVRIGIATGTAVVGDLVDRDTIIGATPNIAARLQSVAPANTVVVSSPTHRLAGFLFDCVKCEPTQLKGIAEPVAAWRVIRERAYVGHFEGRRVVGLTPFVNRKSELRALAKRWRRAAARKIGQVVLITGEPGIGKSRLVEELARNILNEPKRRIDFFGSYYLRNSPLSPVVAQLEWAAGIARDDSSGGRRNKLDALLAATPETAAQGAGAVFASLLSLPAASDDAPLDPDAGQRKQRTFDVVANQILEQSKKQPMLLLFEDLHWFDPTTLELLDVLVERIQAHPILIILTFRPEFTPRWRVERNVSLLRLERLDSDAGTMMVDGLAKGRPLSPSLRREIVARSDGSPLFTEELTRAALESSAGDDRVPPIRIPETLQDSLLARLDRWRVPSDVLHVAAAIGREFNEKLLETVARLPPVEVRSYLDRLVEGDVLRRYSSPSGTVYVYKHALVQDAAYETMLHSRRPDTHARIARAIESHFPETAQTQPELLAQHWERAGDIGTAIDRWKRAAQRAAERSAPAEAEVHLRHALQLLTRLPDNRERDLLELEINVQLGAVLRAVRGPAGLDTGAAFRRARELCSRTGDTTLLAPALAGAYGYHLVRAENTAAGAAARELLALAEADDDRLYQMIGHRAVGAVLLHTGHLTQARKHLERSLSLYDETAHGPLAFVYGTDHAQTASSFLAFALRLLGFTDQADAREQWAMALGARIGHVYSLVQTDLFRILVRLLAGERKAAEAIARTALALATQGSFSLAATAAQFFLVACRSVRGGDYRGQIAELERCAQDWLAVGALNYLPMQLAFIAQAYAAAGDPIRGLELLSEAQSLINETGERWIEAEIQRLMGDLELTNRRAGLVHAEEHYPGRSTSPASNPRECGGSAPPSAWDVFCATVDAPTRPMPLLSPSTGVSRKG